jgi:hypothetical protein
MRAKAGDEVVVRRRRFADEDRLGTIMEVHGDNGRQPYLIRWQDGHECLVSPSSGTFVEHHPSSRSHDVR